MSKHINVPLIWPQHRHTATVEEHYLQTMAQSWLLRVHIAAFKSIRTLVLNWFELFLEHKAKSLGVVMDLRINSHLRVYKSVRRNFAHALLCI